MDIGNLYGLDISAEKLYNKNKSHITKNLDFENFIYMNYRTWFFIRLGFIGLGSVPVFEEAPN